MAIGPNRKVMSQAQAEAAAVDVGLRAYMLRVYNYMCVALALTGAVAFFVSTSPAMQQAIFGTPLMWVALDCASYTSCP